MHKLFLAFIIVTESEVQNVEVADNVIFVFMARLYKCENNKFSNNYPNKYSKREKGM